MPEPVAEAAADRARPLPGVRLPASSPSPGASWSHTLPFMLPRLAIGLQPIQLQHEQFVALPTVIHGSAQLRPILLAGAYLLLEYLLAAGGQEISSLEQTSPQCLGSVAFVVNKPYRKVP